jgi:pimeloyl-ACP methyl ester carboxylesterase
VIVWSHGRSINAEDSESPTPDYLFALRDDGWDVMRFDRKSHGDTLSDSSKRLTEYAVQLKHDGYKQVILSGQSFGAFLSLMAADDSDQVDAVIATAPAAYGSFDDFYDSWHLNATRLYPILEKVKHARIMLAFFHDDDFDPGGRGEKSREILASRNLGRIILDQPAFLKGHWAAHTGLFLRRYGPCIRHFANASDLNVELFCVTSWGDQPSVELVGSTNTGSSDPQSSQMVSIQCKDAWYGFYPNGREVGLCLEKLVGQEITATYMLGPSVDNEHPSAKVRRIGRTEDDKLIFEGAEQSTLRFVPLQNGGLKIFYTSADGKERMTANIKQINPKDLGPKTGS